MRTYRVKVARSGEGAAKSTSYEVALEDRMTILDALFQIQETQDDTLSFRCACRVGMCGTCAMYINHQPRLACKTRPSQLGAGTLTIGPLPHLPVIKDLVVSLEPFFDQWKRVKPALHSANRDSTELAKIPEGSRYAEESKGRRDCITCGICYAACGVKGTSEEYLGPAAINKAFLRLIDPRDDLGQERIDAVNAERSGVWRCHTQFNCTAACPKRIELTDTIGRIKRAMIRGKLP